jgi:hypothetical protein
MTVAELIKVLRGFDGTKRVHFVDHEYPYEPPEVESVRAETAKAYGDYVLLLDDE